MYFKYPDKYYEKHPKYDKKSINSVGDFEYDLKMNILNKNIKFQFDIDPLKEIIFYR